MSEKINTKKMVSHKLHQENSCKFNYAWEQMVKAYTRLRDLNLAADAIPHHPKEITLERLTVFVNEKKIGVNEQTKKYYDGILFRATKDIKFIRMFFNTYPLIEIEVDETDCFFERALTAKNKADVLEALSLIDVPVGDGIPTIKYTFGPKWEQSLVDTQIVIGKAGQKINLSGLERPTKYLRVWE